MKQYIIVLFLLLSISTYSTNEFIDCNYTRPGISVILLNDCKSFFYFDDYESKIIPPDQFYLNRTFTGWLMPETKSIKGIENSLLSNKIAAAAMYNLCDIKELQKRVRYNLSDVEFNQLSFTNRGVESTLKNETWLREIESNNYILVLGFKNIKTQVQKNITTDAGKVALGVLSGTEQTNKQFREGYFADIEAFLFKIEVSDEDHNEVFKKNWNNPDNQKKYNYHIKLVASKICNVDGTSLISEHVNLKEQLLNYGINQSLNQLGEIYSPVLPKTRIISSSPIKANIGMKEGVETEQPFKVYEYRINSNGERIVQKVGYARIRVPSDNRNNSNGNSKLSRLYKAGWGNITEGMFIVPQRFKGIDISLVYGLNNASDISVRIGKNVAPLLGITSIPSLKIYGDFGYIPEIIDNNPVFADKSYLSTNKLRSFYYGVGIEKDIYIFGGIQLTPFFQLSNEFVRYKNKDEIAQLLAGESLPKNYGNLIYISGGGRFSLNLTDHLKVVYSYYLSTRNFKSTDGIGSIIKQNTYPTYIVTDNKLTSNIALKYEF